MPNSDSQSKGLGQTIAKFLHQYFTSHSGSLPKGTLYDMIIQEVEKPLLQETLKAVGGNQSKAAEVLGINRNTLRKKLANCGISSK